MTTHQHSNGKVITAQEATIHTAPALPALALAQQAAVEIRALLARTAENIVLIGQRLQEVKTLLGHGHWEDWLRTEFTMSLSSATRMMRVAEEFKSVILTDLPIDVSALYQLAARTTPEAVRVEAVALAQNGTAVSVPKVKALLNKHRGVTTLADVKAGGLALPVLQDPAPGDEPYETTFTRTNEQVDWSWWTWSPVTGCLHDCIYCFSRDFANRFYPEKFQPTFRPERLSAPHNTPVPKEAETDVRAKSVFTVIMGDLFGKWVPQAWIDAVLAEVRAAPQWNFLFLTKFPQRLAEIAWPENAWVGTSVDR